jgi:hypothetical protein
VTDWETKCNSWAKGPSPTEQQRCDNAQRMVKEAIDAHPRLKNRNIRVSLQGSYPNRTNVRQESDVDICVLCTDVFFPDYEHTPRLSDATLGFSNATYSFAELKTEVEAALVTKFGRTAIKRGDKAFNIKENTYRVNADVVPTFEGRLYYYNNGVLDFHRGTVLECDSDGRRINNWPDQHYARGVARHEETGDQFKKKVRILKNLRNDMRAAGIASAKKVSSFLLESLVYNCKDEVFTKTTHREAIKAVIRHLWNQTKSDKTAEDMLEVNAIKYLFRHKQPWNRADVHKFLYDAWVYGEFKE